MKVRRLDKLPKRCVTVDDLLERDGVNECLSFLDEAKNDIYDLLYIYSDGENLLWGSNGLTVGRLVSMLEAIKFSILHTEEE